MIRWFLVLIFATFGMAAHAQSLTAVGTVIPKGSTVKDTKAGGLQLTLRMTQRVPYRVFTMSEPNRVVVEFKVLGFAGLETLTFDRSDVVSAVHFGAIDATTSRLVMEVEAPLAVRAASMAGSTAQVSLQLAMVPVSQETFDAFVQWEETDKALGLQVAPPKARPVGDAPWIIALDPGHGGIDPGADGGRRSEADLMLLFAFELRDALRRKGGFDVVMTREMDVFVGLEDRMTIAREAGADVFISLHADAVAEGYAEGLTTYVLSEDASTQADAKLAARHNRADILAGVDLTGQGDSVAEILLDLARRETTPRTQRLSKAVVDAVVKAGGVANSKPFRQGDFAVLRSADMPSVLVELGFLSSPADLARLNDPVARKTIINGIVNGLVEWAVQDAAEARLLRQ